MKFFNENIVKSMKDVKVLRKRDWNLDVSTSFAGLEGSLTFNQGFKKSKLYFKAKKF